MVLLVIIFLSSCRYGTFATGGCDGFVNVWDGTNKKRLYQVDHAVVLLHWETSEMFIVFMISLLLIAVLKVRVKHCCSFIQ